jgi:hypothetical protein
MQKSFNIVLVLPRFLQALVDVLLVESSSRPPTVSRQSPATSAFVTSPSTLAVSGVKFRSIEPRPSHEVIHRFGHRFHPLRYFCILQYRHLSPTSPKKGDSLSDPSSFGLQRSSPSTLSSPQVIQRIIPSVKSSLSPSPLPSSPKKGDSHRLSNPCIRP